MAFIPVENVLQLEVRGFYLGQEVENVLYFDHGTPITAPDVEALFDWFESVWVPAIMGDRAIAYTVDELYGTDLTTAVAPTYTRVIIPPITGGATATPPLPGSIAMCISFRTLGRGRSSRGRNYATGFVESQVINNNFELTTINNVVADYELLLGGGTFPAGWTWVVVSRFSDGSPRPAGLAQPIIAAVSTDITVDSQRGRLR